MNSKKIFISGKIGTYDINAVSEETIKKFAEAEMYLRKTYPDCQVFNPLEFAEHIAGNDVWLEGISIPFECLSTPFENLTLKQRTRYLKNENIRVLTESTAIYLLTDWRSSAGALFEKEVADFLGLEIIYQKEKQ
ncbi:MAG: DUF4406 domain-containing protein [Bacteroidales bacterium]|nr:DUF4406 domain-containing protein [Bacteroidales bacterium]